MNPESISLWADVAAIFILAQLLLFTLLMAVALGIGWWYLRQARKKLIVPFLMGQVYALRAQQITTKVSDNISNAPIALYATAERIQVTARTFTRRQRAPKD
ncbi:MAG: hypothetical protein BroJett039_05820 [Chloroflexota bacterium]|nr:MAG: hypothetical protein BroJett039_05820 [Chloroflexota bacterium]